MSQAAADFVVVQLEPIDALGWDDKSLLNPEDGARFDAISHPIRRRQYVAGRRLLKKLLATYDQDGALDGSLDISAVGKPIFRHQPNLHLSISHSGEWVACAIASVPVGLDIERIEQRRSTAELIKQVCSAEEQLLLQDLTGDHRDRLFTELWTLKESWLKCLGAALDIERLRTIKWALAKAPAGNCVSWITTDGLAVTALGPPVPSLLSALPDTVQALCTTRQVQGG